MKIISIITEKGGVGKTTSTLHLGAALSEQGYKVLLIDFDTQRNLSFGCKIPKDYPYTIKNLLEMEEGFRVTQKGESLFVLAGDRRLENISVSRQILKEILPVIGKNLNLDFILIDCPPQPLTREKGLGEIALIGSDYVISPIEAEPYSIDGIKELLPSLKLIQEKYNPDLEFLGFYFNKVLTNTVNFREYKITAENEAGDYFFNTFIRQDVNVENAKKVGKTIFQISPTSRASIDFKNLTSEILSKIK